MTGLTQRMNRTGSRQHADETNEMVEGSREFRPSSQGDETRIVNVRTAYMAADEPIGSIPLPLSGRGVVESLQDAITGHQPLIFADRLGERLAFERGGTRLYQAFLGKVGNAGRSDGRLRIDLDQVEHFMNEELEHAQLLAQCIERTGGDPTAVTPAADIASVQTIGVIQVITDARTTVDQSLCALLTAELVDHDGWELLMQLARGLGHADMASEFENALRQEAEHLMTVRRWVKSSAMIEAGIGS